jgi:hypothetical protein
LRILLPYNGKLICYTNRLTQARGKGSDICGLNRLGKKLLEFDQSQNTNVCGLPLKQSLQEFLGAFEFTDNFTLIIIETESGGP